MMTGEPIDQPCCDASTERDVAKHKAKNGRDLMTTSTVGSNGPTCKPARSPSPTPAAAAGSGARDQAGVQDDRPLNSTHGSGQPGQEAVQAGMDRETASRMEVDAAVEADAEEEEEEVEEAEAAGPARAGGLLAAAAARLAQRPGRRQRSMSGAPSLSAGAEQALHHTSGDTADEIEDSDLDLEQRPAATAAAERRKRSAAQQQVGGSDVEDDGDAAAAGGTDEEISDSDDGDSPQQQQPAQGQGSSSRRQAKQQQQQAAAGGRARRAAAVAAVDRMRGAEAMQQEQEQSLRRSSRTRQAPAAAEAAAVAAAPAPRPRRAAAAAAKEATAAALAAEAAPAGWAGTPDSDSYLGTPDASDAEGEEGEQLGSSEGYGAGSESAASDLSDEDGSGSWGTGAKQQRRRQQQQPSRQQPKRGKGGRAVLLDDSSDEEQLDSQEGDEGVEEEEEGSDQQQEGSSSPDAAGTDEGDDQPPNLNAFRFNGRSSTAKAAAAGGAGSKRDRQHGSSGSMSGSEEPDAADLAGVLQAEEALRGDVLEPSEFAPLELAKLPRGDDVERCIAARFGEDDSISVLVKLAGRCYRHAVWLPAAVVEAKRPALLRNFLSRHAGGDTDTSWVDNNNINPAWYRVDRVVSEYRHPRQPTSYMVKWVGLEYSEATWETEEELCRDGAGQVALARFRRWSTPPGTKPPLSKRPRQELLDEKLLPSFKNGRKLRDYQEESLQWMVNNYRGQIVSGRWQPRNCILGDEMGLGKTAQSIAVMAWIKQYAGAAAPCMVVAPLTTLGHWKREVETWTDLNVVLYAGSAEDRRIIREHEFFWPKHKTYGARFNVLLSSYETVLKDKTELKKLHFEALIVDEAHRLKNSKSATRQALQELSVRWLLMLSGTPVQNNMRELQGLMSLLDARAYGDVDDFMEQYGGETPSVEQIRALQAALAPVLLRRMKEDVEDLPEKEEVVIWVELTPEQRKYYRALYSKQIGALLGGGMNKNLPGMRNLAMELRKLCCHPFLCDGLEDDMTLKWTAQGNNTGKTQKELEVENYTRASGKMLLLHKLLPKLRAEGRQVLIFSQFKMMLDVIEDYLAACDYPFERIDGDTKHSERQAAIDRFMAAQERQRSSSKTPGNSRGPSPSPDAAAAGGGGGEGGEATGSGQQGGSSSRGPSPPTAASGVDQDMPFVFLLSTRAGGQGITLTSADTVIIYDSDWNPQNDLQAMARCHRIGQEKEVTVYRLVSKHTYEQQLFEVASRKYGLDEAILSGASSENPENDAARIEQLLRLGAHALLAGGEAAGGAAAGAASGEAGGEDKGFAAEDIDQILLGRSEKRQLGSRKGNTFSVAHFGDGGGELDPEAEATEVAEAAEVTGKDAKTFWSELLPEAAAEHKAQANRKEPEVLGPRRRTRVDYREANMGRVTSSSSDFTGGAELDEDEGEEGSTHPGKGSKRSAEEDAQHAGSKKAKKKGEGPVFDAALGRELQPWKASQVDTVRDAVVRYGMDRMDKVVAQCQLSLSSREPDEIKQLCEALLLVLDEMDRLQPALAQQDKAAKQATLSAVAAAAGDVAATAAKYNNNMSVQYVNGMRDGLVKAGLEAKLPPACSKALLSLDQARRMGRAPNLLKQALADHHKVHEAMVAAGLVVDTGSKAAAPGSTPATSSQQQQQGSQQGAQASTPAKAQPAGAAVAAGNSSTPGGVDASKRVWVAPRVLLKGSKGMPLWWKREHDDLLLRGCYSHGFASGTTKLNSIVEELLLDQACGFTTKLGLDAEAKLREDAAAARPKPMPKMLTVTAPDGTSRTMAQFEPQLPLAIDAQQLAAAQQQKRALQQQHPGIELHGPTSWHRLLPIIAQRLKRVRAALLDPHYVEPATPNKQLHMHSINNNTAQPAGAAAAAAAGGGSPQQRLQLTPATDGSMTYKGKKVIGGGFPAAAAGGGPGSAARPGAMPALSPMQQQQHMLLTAQQRAVAQQTAATIVNVVRTAQQMAAANAVVQQQMLATKRQAEQQLFGANKRPNSSSNNSSPNTAAGAGQQAPPQASPATAGLPAATLEAAKQARLQEQRRLLQQQQQARQQQQQRHEVVKLLDDDSSDDELPPAAPSRAPAATPAQPAAPPASGLLVRRVPAGADLSQEQSVDEPVGGEGLAAPDHTPAPGTVSSSGMQQLLGSGPSRPAGSSPRKGQAAAADHPVYGNSAVAAGAAAPAAAGKRKHKEDPKQRKLNDFFGKVAKQ